MLSVRVWDGGGDNGYWWNAANWVGNVRPNPGDDLRFTGNLRMNPTNNFAAGTTFNSIEFAANNFSLHGNSVNLTSGITVSSGVTGSTITLPLTSSGTIPVTVVSTGLTISGVISGSASLSKEGAGTLVLSGQNSYTGTTTVNAGTLRISGANDRLPTGTAVTLANTAGAVLDLNAWSQRIGSLSGGGTTGGNLTLGAGTLTVGDSTDTTYGGIISGTGSLIKEGSGMLILTGANTYAGTTISAGTLQVGAGAMSGSLGTGDAVNNASLVFNRSDSVTVGNAISGAGSLTQSGLGTVTLTGTNSYTGGTSMDAGTLAFNSGGLGTSGPITFAGDATLQWNGTNTQDVSSRLAINNGVTATLHVGANNVTLATGFGGSGSGAVTKEGTGALTLSGANAYTGATTINAGRLQLSGGSNRLPAGTAVALANAVGAVLDLNNQHQQIASLSGGGSNGGNVTLGAGTLTVGDSTDRTYAGIISGSGGLTKQGSGVLTLTGASTYTGATTINAGTVRLSGGDQRLPWNTSVTLADTPGALLDLNGQGQIIGSLSGGGPNGGNVALGSNVLEIYGSATTTYAGSISGSGDLLLIGGGALTLSGPNTYTGLTAVDGSTLSVNSIGDFGASALGYGPLRLNNGATLRYIGSAAATTGRIVYQYNPGTIEVADPAGSLELASPYPTLDQGLTKTGPGTLTMSSMISGSASVTVNGGTMVMAGVNTYTGATTINAGTLRLSGGDNRLPTGTAVVLANAAGAVLDLNNQYQQIGSLNGGGTIGGNVTLGSGWLVVGDSTDMTYAGSISGSGTVQKTGSGTLTLNGTNTYTGGTAVTAGRLRLSGGSNRLPTGTMVAMTDAAGAVLDLNGQNQQIASLAGGGSAGGNVTLGSGVLTVGDASSRGYLGIISGDGGIVKQGSGVLYLYGANTYTGATIINEGTLRLWEGDNRLPVGTAVTLANTAGAILDLSGHNQQIASLSGGGTTGGNVSLGSGTLTVSGGSYGGVVSGSGSLVKNGSGTLTLTGANMYTGGTTIDQGILQVGDGVAANGSVTGDIADYGTLVFAVPSSSTAIFSGVISGSGSMTKSGPGMLLLTDASTYTGGTTVSLGTLHLGDGFSNGSVAGNIADNGLLVFDVVSPATFGGVISGSGSMTKTGAGTLTLTGANTYASGTTIGQGTLQLGDGVLANGSVAGNITDNAVLKFAVPSWIPATFGGVISGSGSMTKTGPGTLTLTRANTYTGGTTITQGVLQLGDGVSQNGSVAGNIIDNAVLTFAVPSSPSATYSGVISGSGSVTKTGPGTLVLSATSSYTGPTTVNSGTLCVTGSIAGATTVATGATLSGTSVTGPVTAGGSVSPGVSGTGTMSTGSLAFAAGALNVDLTDSGSDRINVAGTVSLASTILNITTTRANNDGVVLVLINNDGSDLVTGTFLNLSEGSALTAGGVTYMITYRYNADTLQFGTGNDVALIDEAALPAPANLVATAVSGTRIDLAWTGSAGATGYNVERSPDGSNWTQVGTTATTNYQDTGLPEAALRYYRVRAYSGTGTSPYSNTASATTPLAAPTNVTATIIDGSQVNLSWSDNSLVETANCVEQWIDDSWQEVQWAGANVSSLAVIGVFQPTLQYRFRVKAYAETDFYAAYSAPSNDAKVTAGTWPMAPTGLTTTAVSNTRIELAWSDNANDESAYKIERTTDGVTWTVVTSTLDENTVSYYDTSVTDGTLYGYRVRALNDSGGSGYAENAAATLPTAPANFQATVVSGTEIDLSWTASPYATGYKIWIQPEFSDTWDLIATVPSNQTTYAATGLLPGGTYYAFYVAPTNSTATSAIAYIDPGTQNTAPGINPVLVGADPVTTTSTTLTAEAWDDQAESNLTYSWSVIQPVDKKCYFSRNNTNAAKNTTVTFYASGYYALGVTVTDAHGLSTFRPVTLWVNQTLTDVTISPREKGMLEGDSQLFSAFAIDQFGNAMDQQPPFDWSVTGGGTLSYDHVYYAPFVDGDTYATVSASAAGKSATAYILVKDLAGQPRLKELTVHDYAGNYERAIDAAIRDLYVAENENSTATVAIDTRFGPGGQVHLTVERSDGGFGVETDLTSEGTIEFFTLPVTPTARDFTITASLDASGDEAEIDVHVVKPWRDEGTWTNGEAALVRANVGGASLMQLARAITGDAYDYLALPNVGGVTKDKPIDVTPLLSILEQRLRENVVAAANSPKAAKFGSDAASPRGLPNPGMGESEVNKVFDVNAPQPWPYYSCSGMVQVLMARGVILTLEAGLLPNQYLYEFDHMGLTVGAVSFVPGGGMETFSSSDYFTVYSPAKPRDALKPGDWVRFWNRKDYKEKHPGPNAWYNAESTVMVGSDSYYGWEGSSNDPGESTDSHSGWKQLLVVAYNLDLPQREQIRTTQIQGYNDVPTDYPEGSPETMNQICAGFFNVPALGQRIFAYRSGESP